MNMKMKVVMAVGIAMLGISTLAQAGEMKAQAILITQSSGPEGVFQQPAGYIHPRLLLFASMLS